MKPFRGKRTEPKSRPGDSTRGARPGAGPRTRTGRGAQPAGRAPGRTFPGRAPGPAGRRPQGRGAASPRGRPSESRPAARPWAAAPALRGPGARRGAAQGLGTGDRQGPDTRSGSRPDQEASPAIFKHVGQVPYSRGFKFVEKGPIKILAHFCLHVRRC